ncbi:MAG: TonB-dependent receptor [Sphingobium sp.]|nr:TonB-dependent receptor [Sphingobium sp.]
MTDRLNFTAGLRYTKGKQGARQLPGSLWTFFLPPDNMYFPQKISASKPSWNASLDYAVTPNLLAYATTRGSWRAGGLNFTLAPSNASIQVGGNIFSPETTKDVEVGLKYSGRDLGVPLTLKLAFLQSMGRRDPARRQRRRLRCDADAADHQRAEGADHGRGDRCQRPPRAVAQHGWRTDLHGRPRVAAEL